MKRKGRERIPGLLRSPPLRRFPLRFCLYALPVRRLLIAVRNPASGKVVGREVNRHPISLQDADVVLAHLAAHVGQHLVPVLELHAERRVGEDLRDGPHHLDGVTGH